MLPRFVRFSSSGAEEDSLGINDILNENKQVRKFFQDTNYFQLVDSCLASLIVRSFLFSIGRLE